jgi:nitronate monooxygenase
MNIPRLTIRGFDYNAINSGGMGAGVSLNDLTRAVFDCGGLGVLSSAGLKDILRIRNNKPYTTYQAVREEIEQAMTGGRLTGLNVMCRLKESYDETIRAALEAKVSALFLGAGIPRLIENRGETALIPIVSSAFALKVILKRWAPELPDAVVIEGDEAGGHLGFKLEHIGNPAYSLEKILSEILEISAQNGNFPIIVAGGIYTHEDIVRFLNLGARGVQLGTRFLATHESGADAEFKRQVVSSTKEDIIVVQTSPCDFPFRILRTSPMYLNRRPPKCNLGYVLTKDNQDRFTVCKAHPNNPENNQNYLCICNGLLAAVGLAPNEPPLYTVGSNAYRIKEIISVSQLMKELVGG